MWILHFTGRLTPLKIDYSHCFLFLATRGERSVKWDDMQGNVASIVVALGWILASSANAQGLVGAPVDPRYGQSNQVGQLADIGSLDRYIHDQRSGGLGGGF